MVRLRDHALQGQRLIDKTAHGIGNIDFHCRLGRDGVTAPGVFDESINGDLFLALGAYPARWRFAG